MSDIANYIYEHPGELDLDLKGIWIADRTHLIILSVSCANHYYSRHWMGCRPRTDSRRRLRP